MTNKDQLNKLKEPWRSQAFENGAKQNTFDNKWLGCSSVSFLQTMRQAFDWNLSEQKHSYWSDIARNPQNYTNDEIKTDNT